MDTTNTTAYDLCRAILNINETIEMIKDMNTGTYPNQVLCTVTELLTDYRSVCISLLKRTEIL